MNALKTAIEVSQVSEAQLDEPSEGYCSGDYEITLKIGEHELTVPAWCHCGWLAPGANADLDGSGLSLWGSSQPGGWRVVDGDGAYNGRVSVDSSTDEDYDSLIVVSATHLTSVDITPDMIPEWKAAIEAAKLCEESAGDDDDSHKDAYDTALSIREDIINRLTEVLEDYSYECPEPDAETLYDSLNEIEGLEGLPVRFGDYKGAGPVLAWTDGEDYDMDYHPSEVPSRLRDLLADKLDEIIAYAVKPRENE